MLEIYNIHKRRNMRYGYNHLYLIGVVLNFVALVLIFIYDIPVIAAGLLLVASLVILGTLVLGQKQFKEENLSDERTRMIGAKALSYAWWIGSRDHHAVLGDALEIWRPGSLTMLGISFLLLFGPAIIFVVYLSHRA